MMTPSPAKSVISVSSARTVRPMQLTSLFTTASFRAQSRTTSPSARWSSMSSIMRRLCR